MEEKEKEIAEYIYKDNSNNIIFTLIYNLEDLDIINKSLLIKHNVVNKLLCLDLHGVADLYVDNTEKITNKIPIFIISFVGRYSETRANARDQIKTKIENNQIQAGILVFKKNSKPSNGKAVVIKNLIENNKNIYFIDDGIDNIIAVNKLKKEGINLNTFGVNGDNIDEIKQIISEIEKDIIGGSMSYYKLNFII
jgi:hypothetical protein